MKIVIDSAIPFLSSLFEEYAEVVYIAGSAIDADVVRDADALIVRTRTRCDEALLAGSSVRVIATATIGYDHIDMEYCHSRGIDVRTAAGCNARGVLQWIGAALALLQREEGWTPSERVVGVVGVGNVGSLVAHYCAAWGFRVLCCDPPRAEREGGFLSLEELLPQVDILTLHTPLNDTSHHLLNSRNIGQLKPSATIINTSRGECVESAALRGEHRHKLLLDVWECEPNIDLEILRRARVSTPHIAGYSLQGKANGSAMSAQSVARALDLPLRWWYPDVERNEGERIEWERMCSTIDGYFDIDAQSKELKLKATEFEVMRNSYNYRNEYF